MSRELLKQRCQEASASWLEAQGPIQLAQAIGRQAGLPVVLQDHPWLRQAAEHLLPDRADGVHIAGASGLIPATAVDTAVVVGLGAVPTTGSVLVAGRTWADWRLTLCPRRLVVVIPAARAALTLAEALDSTAQEPAGLVSWLTGPSRTADIEKVLVLGAQGAAELVVILYTSGPGPA